MVRPSYRQITHGSVKWPKLRLPRPGANEGPRSLVSSTGDGRLGQVEGPMRRALLLLVQGASWTRGIWLARRAAV